MTGGELEAVLVGELVDEHQAHGDVAVVDKFVIADELLDEWLTRSKTRSAHTGEAYARDIGYWLDFLDDQVETWLDARGRHIADYQQWLQATPLRSTGKPPAPTTVARRLAVVSALYRWAIRREVLHRNPVDFVDRPEIDPDHSDTSGLTEDEARRLIRAAFGMVASASGADVRRVADRDSVMVAVLLVTGLRCSEICGAQVDGLGYDSGYRVLSVTRKGGKRGKVPLGAAAELVDRRLSGVTSGPLFTTRSGQPVTRQWVFRAVRRVAVAAAIPDPGRVTPHALRHTFATLALDRQTPLNVLQASLGHADPRTTMRYDRNRNRLDQSPTHVLGPALLKGNDDKTERLF